MLRWYRSLSVVHPGAGRTCFPRLRVSLVRSCPAANFEGSIWRGQVEEAAEGGVAQRFLGVELCSTTLEDSPLVSVRSAL